MDNEEERGGRRSLSNPEILVSFSSPILLRLSYISGTRALTDVVPPSFPKPPCSLAKLPAPDRSLACTTRIILPVAHFGRIHTSFTPNGLCSGCSTSAS